MGIVTWHWALQRDIGTVGNLTQGVNKAHACVRTHVLGYARVDHCKGPINHGESCTLHACGDEPSVRGWDTLTLPESSAAQAGPPTMACSKAITAHAPTLLLVPMRTDCSTATNRWCRPLAKGAMAMSADSGCARAPRDRALAVQWKRLRCGPESLKTRDSKSTDSGGVSGRRSTCHRSSRSSRSGSSSSSSSIAPTGVESTVK
jgi:hypothetical protein